MVAPQRDYSGARGFVAPPGYRRHRPEATLLYALVAEHYPAFRDRRASEGRPLPGYRVLGIVYRAISGHVTRKAVMRTVCAWSAKARLTSGRSGAFNPFSPARFARTARLERHALIGRTTTTR